MEQLDRASTSTQSVTRRAIAVDGLSGAGKSTVSRRVAEALGWAYLDTGACYRAITVAALRQSAIPLAGSDRSDLLTKTAVAALARLDMSTDPQINFVRLGEDDVTQEIRSERVTSAVSSVAADRGVRAAAVEWQRAQVALADGCVVEGRDIGTVVLPDAAMKLWLTASASRRSARRAVETSGAVAATRAAIDRRDRLDSSRAADPARPAEDAIVIDTDDLDLEGVVRLVLAVAAEHGWEAR